MTHKITLHLDDEHLEMFWLIGWALRQGFIDNETVIEPESHFTAAASKVLGELFDTAYKYREEE